MGSKMPTPAPEGEPPPAPPLPTITTQEALVVILEGVNLRHRELTARVQALEDAVRLLAKDGLPESVTRAVLPEKESHPLDAEIAFFEQHRAEWLVVHRGEFALVKDGDVSFWETGEAAYQAGVDLYGNTSMLIKEVLAEDRPLFLRPG